MLRLFLGLSVALGCSCGTSETRPRDGGPQTGPTRDETPKRDDASTSQAGLSATAVTGDDLASLERPARVPALSFRAITVAARSRARARNSAGLRLYREQKYREAIGEYVAALQADPGHILARYNLSCAFNLAGEPEKGLALLNEFRQQGCKECRERLVRAAEDADWHSMWSHPLFVEIVGVPVADASNERPFWQREKPCPRGTSKIGRPQVEVYCARSGARHGPYARWYSSGNKELAEIGQYADGKRDGVWKLFNESGVLRETGPYRMGNKRGVWSEWYPSGSQKTDGRFVGGLRHGRWTWFEESGAIIKQADFTRGKRGPWLVAPR